ncbi:hypothetical protein BV898_07667 [Hypsibius exemplaris]|uniref:FZ domain-containing protein n=1 Tax=Hypsibius exemplaris TaxID=2072580 RepID=A0A1W0WSU7_HYPEX|nr:hypothetical protein BV898_07667 [Hypsibius exemplaris]
MPDNLAAAAGFVWPCPMRRKVHPCAVLFFLIKFSSGQLNTPPPPSSNSNGNGNFSSLDTGTTTGSGGLCSYYRNDTSMGGGRNDSAVPPHPLRNLGGFYHTPWLDQAFCQYPRRVHAWDLPDPAQECLPTDRAEVLDRLQFMCDIAPDRRSRQSFERLTLPFCGEYTLPMVFGGDDGCVMKNSTRECRDCMEQIYLIDQHAKLVYCHFKQDILGRFDCETPYSVIWKNCSACQSAYRAWVCAMMIPFRMGEHRINPCRSFCTNVEQRCPYLTPDDKVIIAGEPMFFCKDPDIPEIYSAYADPPHCYLPCHLNVSRNATSPEEDCNRHEILKEDLAVYYNMSRRKVSRGTIRNPSFPSVTAMLLLLLTVIRLFS